MVELGNTLKMKIPYKFQEPIRAEYPKHNKIIFEQWLIGELTGDSYLPINWCGFFVNSNYGKNTSLMRQLQAFVNSLDPNKPMYTITQYDFGILTDVSKLKLRIFGSGGGRIDYPLPLICHPHGIKKNNRDIFASFLGSNTHPIRTEIIKRYGSIQNWFISDSYQDNDFFCDVLSRSIFSLCPRGVGLTSFRICESLEQGAIPVYISDKFIIPGHKDFNEYGVLITHEQLPELDHILKSISEGEIVAKQEAGKIIYQEMYTFEGCKNLILNNI